MPAFTTHPVTVGDLSAAGVVLWARRRHYHDPANGWYWARKADSPFRAVHGPFPSAHAAGADAMRHLGIIVDGRAADPLVRAI